MKKFISLMLSMLLCLSAVPDVFADTVEADTEAYTSGAVTAPSGLTVNDLSSPMNSEDVSFGWLVNNSGYNVVQTAYQIIVTDAATGAVAWDSGKIESSEQSNVKCGAVLDEGHPYTWKVKTWDNSGNESEYSAEGSFATGIADESWDATWISDNSGGSDATVGTHNHFWYVRGEGDLDSEKEIAKAVGYFAGAHDYDLYINGEEIGRGQTFDYASESRYQGWDITDAVKNDPSKLIAGAIVRTYGPGQGRAAVDAGFIGRINVYYTDGTSTVITTNPDWKVKTADTYSGTQYRDLGINDAKWSEGDFIENYDARKAVDFTAAEFDASDWTAAEILISNNFALQPELSKPTAELVKPISVTRLSDGTTVADFGAVIPARPSVVFANGTAGRKVTVQGGYVLKSDGSINTDKSQTQKTNMTWNYTQTDGAQTYDAWDHLAFRYLSIPDCGEDFTADTLAAKIVHTNVPEGRESTFTTSNEMLNNVYELMKRSALYSIQNSFVDTPTREKGQFLQDSINISEASVASSYERAASKKAIEQFMASADRYWTGDEAGRLNSVYPNGDGKRDIPDFTINFPYWVWSYYMQTGDRELLEKAYPYVKNTANYITKYINSDTGLVTKLAGGDGNANTYMYGIVDWPDAGRFGYDWKNTKEGARTTVNMLSKRAFDVTALMAAELGETADKESYEQNSESLKAAVNAKLINSNGLYCDGLNSSGKQVSHVSQHANSYALAFDVAPEDKLEIMAEYVASQGMKQGPMTADILVKGLINSGENAALLKLLTNTEDYGWAKEVADGHTFTFESWQADSDSNSQSHGWGAAAAADILKGFAGVTVTEPGASRVRIAPMYADLTSLSSSVQTERGAVNMAYTRNESEYSITITVPANMTADIELPNIGDGKYVEKNGRANSGTAFSVGSGTYEFSYDGNITVLPETLDTEETELTEYDFTVLDPVKYNAEYTGEYTSEDGAVTLQFGASTAISDGGNGFDMYNDGAYIKFTPDKTGKITLDVKMRKASGKNAASTLYMSTETPGSGGSALCDTVNADTDIEIKNIAVEAGVTYYLYNTAGRPTSIRKISYSYPKTYEITVTPEVTDDSIHWSFNAEKATSQSPYDYFDDYADIRLVLNRTAGDTVSADGISFAGTGFADRDKGEYDSIGDNGRYILFMPKYSGTLDISAVFDGTDFKSKCRVYALPLDASSVETVDTAALGAIYKTGENQIVAAETSGSSTAAAKSVEVEENKVYALVTYSYNNYGSTIASFGYKPLKPSVEFKDSDGIKLFAARRNKLEGSCYKMGAAEFKLLDADGNTVQTQTADLADKIEWSIMLDAVEDPAGEYTLAVISDGKEYARLSGITFADMPVIEIGQCEYDGKAITVPVTVPAEDVNENICAYLAEYDEGGRLIRMSESGKISVNSDTEIKVEYERKNEMSEIKLFMWDENMEPYCETQYIYENISSELSAAPAGVTYDSAALIWDKNSGEHYTYEIYQNGSKSDETENLYYVAEGLEPDTEYSFEVKIKDGGSLGTVRMRTAKKGAVLNIADYGAVADGKTKNTVAIQAAIDACPENGTVLIPKGTFLTGAIDLKSNMTLYLEEGAVLKGTANADDYKDENGELILSRFEGWELLCHRSLINIGELDHDAGFTTRNVYIRGKGTISGGGTALANVTGGTANKTDEEKKSTRKRGRLISISNAQNVGISGVTITEPSSWTVHMAYSDRISTYGVTINTSGIRNGDGWDPDSSTNCAIFGCRFATGDDCIAIKSGKNPEGNVINRPTKHIRILNCEVMQPEGKSYSGLGLAIGSEMSGGVEDVVIVDSSITNTRYGIEIKTPRARGGYVRGVTVKDCEVDRIFIHNSDVNYNDDGEASADTPVLEGFTFEGVTASGFDAYSNKAVDAVYIEGFPEEEYHVKGITLKNVTVGNNITLKHCSDYTFDNVKTTDGGEPVVKVN